MIRRVAPLLKAMPPQPQLPPQPFPLIARLGYGADADKVGKE